jgi:hypothetical protein
MLLFAAWSRRSAPPDWSGQGVRKHKGWVAIPKQQSRRRTPHRKAAEPARSYRATELDLGVGSAPIPRAWTRTRPRRLRPSLHRCRRHGQRAPAGRRGVRTRGALRWCLVPQEQERWARRSCIDNFAFHRSHEARVLIMLRPESWVRPVGVSPVVGTGAPGSRPDFTPTARQPGHHPPTGHLRMGPRGPPAPLLIGDSDTGKSDLLKRAWPGRCGDRLPGPLHRGLEAAQRAGRKQITLPAPG